MEDRALYLQMLQAIIGRLSGNSFLIKGWAVTIASAFIAMAVASKIPRAALFGIAPTVLFWGLDAYYLSLERRYRELFEKNLRQPAAGKTLDYTFQHRDFAGTHTPASAGISGHLVVFYGSVILALALTPFAL